VVADILAALGSFCTNERGIWYDVAELDRRWRSVDTSLENGDVVSGVADVVRVVEGDEQLAGNI